MTEEKGKRSIKLVCPSVSKQIVHIIASDEQKLDLGSIARAFGLDPNTLKLNGHFISRGLDLIASSVTWKSLIGFFSARGLSTGASDSDALLVHGKLSKISPKRSRDLEDSGNGNLQTRDNKRPQHEVCRLLDNGKVETSNAGQVDSISRTTRLAFKRNWCLEEVASQVKRIKHEEDVSGLQERKGNASTYDRVPCSFIVKNLKRARGDDMDAAAAAYPLKKIR